MTKEIWINLPVKDLDRSKSFFSALGFTLNQSHPGGDSASFLIGQKGMVLMLFPETTFKNFVQHEIADPSRGSEVLFSIDAESREEVDEMAEKAEKAGGVLFSKPAESQGWMYGCAFTDPDGHRWNVLHMDTTQA